MKSTTITSVTSVACETAITGVGDSNFGPVAFEIRVSDGGEPGTSDTFAIQAGLYAAGGVLAGGNVDVHGQTCP